MQTLRVEPVENGSSLATKAMDLLVQGIVTRSNVALVPAGNAALCIKLSVEPGVEAEGFRIASSSDGDICIVGNDARGVLYGVGKFLRSCRFQSGRFEPSAWRGPSIPEKPIRGVYFATHFGNFYEVAPIPLVKRYVEALALWGCNALMVWFDMHQYKGLDDPNAMRMIARLRAILRAANDVGMGAGLLFLANEGYANSPASLRVTPAPMQYNVELCPSKPAGMDLILKQRRAVLEQFADIDVRYVCMWPHDQGGCGCDACNPWGGKGFVTLLRKLGPLVREFFPTAKLIASTWGFDYHMSGEYQGLWDAVEQQPDIIDYLMVDAHTEFPAFVLEHAMPAGKPLLNFPEISMRGMLPWGGFGLNPLPRHIDHVWQPAQRGLSGGFPYSEGIFEDVNKVMVLQRYWSPRRPWLDILREYAAFVTSPDYASVIAEVLTSLEPVVDLCIHSDLKPDLFRGDASHPLRAHSNLGDRPLYVVPDPQDVFAILSDIDVRLADDVRSSWRWRLLLLRVTLQHELFHSGGRSTETSERCFSELTNLYHAQRADPAVQPPSVELVTKVVGSSTECVKKAPSPRLGVG